MIELCKTLSAFVLLFSPIDDRYYLYFLRRNSSLYMATTYRMHASQRCKLRLNPIIRSALFYRGVA